MDCSALSTSGSHVVVDIGALMRAMGGQISSSTMLAENETIGVAFDQGDYPVQLCACRAARRATCAPAMFVVPHRRLLSPAPGDF